MHNLIHQCKVLRNAAPAAAGVDGAFVTCTEVDMSGYQNVMFLFVLGTIAANGVFTAAVKGSDVTATYGAGTIGRLEDNTNGNSLVSTIANDADTDDNKIIAIDIHQPGKKFVRAEYQRTVGNVTLDSVIAILYNGQWNPQGIVGDLENALSMANPTQRTT